MFFDNGTIRCIAEATKDGFAQCHSVILSQCRISQCQKSEVDHCQSVGDQDSLKIHGFSRSIWK